MMRTDPKLVLYGRYVNPKRLRDAEFGFPELEPVSRQLHERKI
ncbi:DUF1731 domain-containing protein [Rubripirellula sp.]|nr:DUF1731 domain-containing protein [Rubripirellula sp.]